jgi:hypothetical protein
MFNRSRAVHCICVCSALLAVAAGSAIAYTGTTKGKKLAAQLLSSYKHVHYLAGSVHGSVYYCPEEFGGYFEAPGSVPASCAKHPAKASWVNTLKHGKGASAVGKVTAKGRPTIAFVAQKSATFIRAQGAKCWTKQKGTDYNFVGLPPFSFFPNEYMTVGHKHHGEVQLIGTMSGGAFKEIDTLNAKTHQMIGESIYFNRNHKAKEQHLLTSYHTAHKAPKVPRTTPVC